MWRLDAHGGSSVRGASSRLGTFFFFSGSFCAWDLFVFVLRGGRFRFLRPVQAWILSRCWEALCSRGPLVFWGSCRAWNRFVVGRVSGLGAFFRVWGSLGAWWVLFAPGESFVRGALSCPVLHPYASLSVTPHLLCVKFFGWRDYI